MICCLLEESTSSSWCEAQNQAKMLKENQGYNQNTPLEVGYRSPFQGVCVLWGSAVGMGHKDAGLRGRSDPKDYFQREIFLSLLSNLQALAVLYHSCSLPLAPQFPGTLQIRSTSCDPSLLLPNQSQWGKETVLRRSSFIHLPTKSSYWEEGSPLSMSLWDKLPWDLCPSGKTNCK